MYLGYPSKKALCASKNVSYCKFTAAIRDGMTLEQALEHASVIGANRIRYNGITGVKEIAASLGLSFNQLRYAISEKGLSIDEAVAYLNGDKAQQKEDTHKAFMETKKPVELSPLWALALGIKL